MTFSQKIQSFTSDIEKSIRQYPLETLLSVVVLTAGCFDIFSTFTNFVKEACLCYFPIFFLILNIIHFYTQKRAKFLYYAFGLIFCGLLFFPNPQNTPYYIVALAITVLLYVIHLWHADNTKFAKNIMQLFLSTCIAGLIAGLAFVLVLIICSSIGFLFEVRISEKVFLLSALTLFQCFMPILFLHFYRSSTFSENRNKITELIFNYLLTPALLIYTFILAIYGLKILIQWELPKGTVAYLVLGFVSLFCLLKMFYPLFGKPMYQVIYKYLFLIVVLPLLLFWVGFLYRIQEYGFTEIRIYLGLAGSFLTISSLLLSWQKVGRLVYLSVLVIILLVTFTYIPQMSAKNIAIKSQTQRFQKSLQAFGFSKLTVDTKFPALDSTAENHHRLTTLTKSLDYLSNNTDTTYRKEKFGIMWGYDLRQIITKHNLKIIDHYYYYNDGFGNSEVTIPELKIIYYDTDRDIEVKGYSTLQHIVNEKPLNNIQSLWYEIEEEKISIYDVSKPKKTLFSANIDSLMQLQIKKSAIDTMDFITDRYITDAEKERLMTIELQQMRIYLERIKFSTNPIKVIEITPCLLLR